MYSIMEKKVCADFVCLVYVSSKGSKELLGVISGDNRVERAVDWCNRLLDCGNEFYSNCCTFRVIEVATNCVAVTASYIRYEANQKCRKRMCKEYFNL